MKKSDLVSEIARTTGVTGVVAAAMVDSLRTIMQRELSNDRPFVFYGVGQFTPSIRPARVYSNPQNGNPVRVGETRVVKFKASTLLLKGGEL